MAILEIKMEESKWYWQWLINQKKPQVDKLIDGSKLWELTCRFNAEVEIRKELNFKNKIHELEKNSDIAGLMKHLKLSDLFLLYTVTISLYHYMTI